MYGLSPVELRTLTPLTTPHKIQDFLDTLPINHEKEGETCFSPRLVLRHKKAHCLEGALLASIALARIGQEPLLLNFKTARGDIDHAVALYRIHGYWGAISKTNHAVLRFRDPVYRTLRELALSYFHEYFLSRTGKKTLRSFSHPFDVRRFGTTWVTSEKSVWHIADALSLSPHVPFIPAHAIPYLRPATAFERSVTDTSEWDESHPGT